MSLEETHPAPANAATAMARRTGVRGSRTLLGSDHEVAAAILRPTRLGLLLAERPLLSVGDRLDAAAVDAERNEVVLGGVGAPLAEREDVLVGAAVVAVALDEDLDRAELLQPLGVRGQGRPRVVAQLVLVVVEVRVLE